MDVRELDPKEGLALKIWCFWTLVLEKTLENPLNCKEIKPVNPKGIQLLIFIGRTDNETETWILWPPEATIRWRRADSLEKTMMLGMIKGRRRRGRQRARWLHGITNSMDMSWASSQGPWRTGKQGMLQSIGVTKSHTWLSNWTTTRRAWKLLRSS